MKKKILFVLNNMNIGGTEKAFLNMLDIISPEKYEVTLLLLEKKGGYMQYIPDWVKIETVSDYTIMKNEIMQPPLQIVKMYLKNGKFFKAGGLAITHLLFKLTDDRTLYYRYVLFGKKMEKNYDVAVAYCGPFDFLTVYVLDYVKALKKVQWIHFDVSKFQFNTKMCRKLYPKFDKIFVVSQEARVALIEKIPEIENKTETFLNIVSAKKCRELAEKSDGYQDGFTGIRIMTIGRLSEEKGQDIIPEVIYQLQDVKINFRWYLIGDGKLRKIIEEKIEKYGIQDKLTLLGVKENPYPFLKDTNLYIQTSKHEGYCITLAEAKAFDLPIISTDFAGAHEQLDGRESSWIVSRNVECLTKEIKHYLTTMT